MISFRTSFSNRHPLIRSGLIVAMIALLSGACSRENRNTVSDQRVSDSLKSSQTPYQESERAEVTLYSGQFVSSRIIADHIWQFTLKDSTVARNLIIDFYDTTGAITSHLIADSGIILETRNKMIAIGNVVVIGSDSTILMSEELHLDENAGLITSDSLVTIIRGADTLQGIGFESDREMRHIKLRKKVGGSLSGELY